MVFKVDFLCVWHALYRHIGFQAVVCARADTDVRDIWVGDWHVTLKAAVLFPSNRVNGGKNLLKILCNRTEHRRVVSGGRKLFTGSRVHADAHTDDRSGLWHVH